MIDEKKIETALEEVITKKKERKFKQTLELMINFRGIDFNKPENRFNLEVPLPAGRGKEMDIVVFAEGQLATDVKKAGITKVFNKEEMEEMAKDKRKMKKLANENKFLAEPKLMIVVGKTFGPVLGSRGKMPKPLVGNINDVIRRTKNSVIIRSKGKYMPVLHVPVGTEEMSKEDLMKNINAVMESVKGKVQEQNIKELYLKFTMGEPIKIR
jgi:large subunit ribosomal protein L1